MHLFLSVISENFLRFAAHEDAEAEIQDLDFVLFMIRLKAISTAKKVLLNANIA